MAFFIWSSSKDWDFKVDSSSFAKRNLGFITKCYGVGELLLIKFLIYRTFYFSYYIISWLYFTDSKAYPSNFWCDFLSPKFQSIFSFRISSLRSTSSLNSSGLINFLELIFLSALSLFFWTWLYSSFCLDFFGDIFVKICLGVI